VEVGVLDWRARRITERYHPPTVEEVAVRTTEVVEVIEVRPLTTAELSEVVEPPPIALTGRPRPLVVG
jgi:hypothetical protein